MLIKSFNSGLKSSEKFGNVLFASSSAWAYFADIADGQTKSARKGVIYGKHFASMYSGSMFGSGAIVFAVMGYIVANMKPDKTVGMQVELNPKLLAAILGETENDVQGAIDFLCAPDPNSRSKAEQGKRLVRLGQFDYQVVNGMKYREIRDEETRREQNRISQSVHRARKKGLPLTGEAEYVEALKAGDDLLADRILEKHLPK